MSCGSCGTASGSNGCSSGGCKSGDCGKMTTHDWLHDMAVPGVTTDIVEIKFKGGRKAFYKNVNAIELHTGDFVVVDSNPGYHIGIVSLQGELVRLQMKRKNIEDNNEIGNIQRIATKRDLEKMEQSQNRELTTLFRTREIINELKLDMKLSDIEFQADNTKATFYYSAEDRVDFRELIKILAGENKVRVEMRQISLRQEASRLGGIGSCGRELCCSTWITDFKSVSTSAARYQNLSLNPSKLSGQCGRLKCCLNYELDTYMEALDHIPTLSEPLKLKYGIAKLMKTDIFKKLMWFQVDNDANNWVSVKTTRVKEIIKLNKDNKKPFSLELDFEEEVSDAPLNNDLKKLDRKFKKKSDGKPQRRNNPRSRADTNKPEQKKQPQKQNKPTENNPENKQQNNKGPQANRNKRRKPKRKNP